MAVVVPLSAKSEFEKAGVKVVEMPGRAEVDGDVEFQFHASLDCTPQRTLETLVEPETAAAPPLTMINDSPLAFSDTFEFTNPALLLAPPFVQLRMVPARIAEGAVYVMVPSPVLKPPAESQPLSVRVINVPASRLTRVTIEKESGLVGPNPTMATSPADSVVAAEATGFQNMTSSITRPKCNQ